MSRAFTADKIVFIYTSFLHELLLFTVIREGKALKRFVSTLYAQWTVRFGIQPNRTIEEQLLFLVVRHYLRANL